MSYILQALKKDQADSDPVIAAEVALKPPRAQRPWLPWLLGFGAVVNVIALGVLFYPRLTTQAPTAETPVPPPANISRPTAQRELTVTPRSRTAPPTATQPNERLRLNESPRPNQSQPVAPQERVIAPVRESSTAVAASVRSSSPAAPASAGRVLSPDEAAALDLLPDDGPAVSETETPAPAPGPVTPSPQATPPANRPSRVIQLAELPPADRQDFPKLEFSTHIFADDPALRAVVVNARRLSEGESIGEMVLRAVTEEGILVDYRGYRVAVSVIEDWN
ncbi:MAG: general secretion pathway protein GspB [Pseudomonadota bacterium]